MTKKKEVKIMKKALPVIIAAVAVIAVIVLCIVLFAGGEKENEKVPTETTSMEALLSDMENEAKAQLNVGKGVAIYGQIRKVYSNYCVVELIVPNDGYTETFNIAMETEQLAKLNSKQFIAVQGVVSRSDSSGYTITATKMLDLELMDSYIKEKTKKYSFSRAQIYKKLHISLIAEYLSSRGDIFMLRDNDALTEYLIGTWTVSNYGETCEFRADGKYVWNFISSSGRWKEQISTWSVNNGDMSAFRAHGNTNVYILCDNVFIQMGDVNIRK